MQVCVWNKSHPVDIWNQGSLFRRVNPLVVGPHTALDGEEQHLKIPFFLESERQQKLHFSHKMPCRGQFKIEMCIIGLNRNTIRSWQMMQIRQEAWLTWVASLQCGRCWMPEVAAGLHSESWQVSGCSVRWWFARSTSAGLTPASHTYQSSSQSQWHDPEPGKGGQR